VARSIAIPILVTLLMPCGYTLPVRVKDLASLEGVRKTSLSDTGCGSLAGLEPAQTVFRCRA